MVETVLTSPSCCCHWSVRDWEFPRVPHSYCHWPACDRAKRLAFVRDIRTETVQAISTVHTRLAQIALTKQRLEIARRHIVALEQQMRVATTSPFSARQARVDALAVEQELLHDVIEWKSAVVKLKQTQGILAVECGYDLGGCNHVWPFAAE